MKTFFHQPLNSQALDPLEIIRVRIWEGLSFSLGRKEMDPLSTNKLTQEKFQRMVKFCCSGGKTEITIPLFWIRSGDEWLVEQKGHTPSLRGTVGEDHFLPPTTGWLFDGGLRRGGRVFEEDPSLTCSPPSQSPPCCLTVTLSGAAKEAQGKCEGEYKSTGLVSKGREVKLQFGKNYHLSLKVFKLDGPSDFYIFVKPGYTQWGIFSNLKADKGYIISGSAGQACPAHPQNKFSKSSHLNDWLFNKAEDDNDKEDWEVGGVVVQCTVHEYCSTWLGW